MKRGLPPPTRTKFKGRAKNLIESSIRYETKVRVLRRDRCICYLCGTPIQTEDTASVDHVIPRSQGGPDTEENLKAAHVFCNTAKQDMSLEEFRTIAAIWASQRP